MNQQAKNKRKFPYVAVILWVTVALVVAVLGHSLLDTLGIYGMTKAGKSQSITISENHMDVYRYHVAQNQLYYQYMYVQYGLAEDPTGGLVKALNWTAEDFISYMLPMTIGSGNYDEMAYQYGEQYLTYCEGAKAAKLYDTYKAEVAADVDEYVEGLRDMAKAGNISFGNFCRDYMGNGVSEKDIRVAMEYYYIGAKYAEKLTDDFASKITDDQKEKYREEHKENFYTTTYTSYKLLNNDMKDKIEACKTVDDVKTVIVDHFLDQKFDDNYKSKIVDKKVENIPAKDQTKVDVRTTLLAKAEVGSYEAVFKDTDTDAYKKAAYEIVKTINTLVSQQTAKISESSAAWVDTTPTKEDGSVDEEKAKAITDLQKWLFGDEARKAGDYTTIKTENSTTSADGKTNTTTYYTWYVVDEAMVLDMEHTKNAHYIVLADDDKDVKDGLTSAKKAEEFRKVLGETEASKRAEKFQELVEKYAPGYSSELVEYISFEDMEESYPDLAKWLYDEKRTEFEVSEPMPVKGDSKDKDKVTGTIIAIYMGENEETWKVTAKNALAGEQVTEWYEKAVKDYGVKMDYKFAETDDSHEGHDHD